MKKINAIIMHYNIIMESFSNDNNSNENLVEKKIY